MDTHGFAFSRIGRAVLTTTTACSWEVVSMRERTRTRKLIARLIGRSIEIPGADFSPLISNLFDVPPNERGRNEQAEIISQPRSDLGVPHDKPAE